MGTIREFPTQHTTTGNREGYTGILISGDRGVGASVQALIDKRIPEIYRKNPTTLEIQAREFFEAMNQGLLSGDPTVIIIPNLSDDTCVLRIVSRGGDIYEMTGEYFIELTKPGYNQTLVDYTGYISEELESMGIIVSIHYTDTEHILDDSEIESYFPELIPGKSNGEFSCEIYRHRHNPAGSASVNSLDKQDATLCDIIFAAIDNLQCNGYSYEGMALDIIYNEDNKISIKTIPAGRLEYFIRSTLVRINPLYQNFSYENAIYSYLDRHIQKDLIDHI